MSTVAAIEITWEAARTPGFIIGRNSESVNAQRSPRFERGRARLLLRRG